jgi:hypothetical protein
MGRTKFLCLVTAIPSRKLLVSKGGNEMTPTKVLFVSNIITSKHY